MPGADHVRHRLEANARPAVAATTIGLPRFWARCILTSAVTRQRLRELKPLADADVPAELPLLDAGRGVLRLELEVVAAEAAGDDGAARTPPRRSSRRPRCTPRSLPGHPTPSMTGSNGRSAACSRTSVSSSSGNATNADGAPFELCRKFWSGAVGACQVQLVPAASPAQSICPPAALAPARASSVAHIHRMVASWPRVYGVWPPLPLASLGSTAVPRLVMPGTISPAMASLAEALAQTLPAFHLCHLRAALCRGGGAALASARPAGRGSSRTPVPPARVAATPRSGRRARAWRAGPRRRPGARPPASAPTTASLRELVLLFKRRGSDELAAPLAELLLAAWRRAGWPRPDAVVPVPMTWAGACGAASTRPSFSRAAGTELGAPVRARAAPTRPRHRRSAAPGASACASPPPRFAAAPPGRGPRPAGRRRADHRRHRRPRAPAPCSAQAPATSTS